MQAQLELPRTAAYEHVYLLKTLGNYNELIMNPIKPK